MRRPMPPDVAAALAAAEANPSSLEPSAEALAIGAAEEERESRASPPPRPPPRAAE